MPRKVTLPCRSLSCSRSDLSCCVSLRLKQYHPTYHPPRISTFHTWKRLSLFSTFAVYFASFRFHNVSPPRYFNFDQCLSSNNVHPTSFSCNNFKNRILKIEFSVNNLKLIGYRIERKKILTCWSVYLNKQFKREESTTRLSDCPSRDEKQERSFVVIGWRSNKP